MIAAYVYPGWHRTAERDASFYPGFTEWDLVLPCTPRFEGHAQPKVPSLGPYDDRDPIEVSRRVRLAVDHGVDAFVYGFFWCRGKRVFQEALDEGFLGSPEGARVPFALMWANRMPRRVLPVRRAEAEVIEGDRLVPSDEADFVRFVAYLAERYFARPNYLHIEGAAYLSIFDATYFLRELGLAGAASAIARARRWLDDHGHGRLHLVAIDPADDVIASLRDVGFDSVTHYVFLPYWKGPFLQDYATCARERSEAWPRFAAGSGLPYVPSVSPGWDASPRGADFGPKRPDKYPWSPVVIGEHPNRFHDALARAVRFAREAPVGDALTMVASLNEWSEGHYLEPDVRFGNGWLEAVRAAKR